MKVLVTGAFGNLGRPTVLELLRQGHQVRCLELPGGKARRNARQMRHGAEVLWGDVRDEGLLSQAVDGVDAVIHNAAVLWPATERNPESAHQVNVGGTAALIRVMEATGTRPLLVYSSSVSIYGPSRDRTPPLTADGPVNPTDHYTRHKVECEALVRGSALPWVIARIGVSLDPAARDASPEAFRTLFDVSPDNRIETIHPDDVALALANAARGGDAVGRTLLIGGGADCQVTHRDLFTAITGALGIKPFPPEAFGTRPFYTDWMDTGEAQDLLGFQRQTFEDYRINLAASLSRIRWALTPLRPLVRRMLLRYSGPWNRR